MKKIIMLFAALAAVLSASAFKTDTIAISTSRLEGPEKVVVITPDGKKDARYPTVYLLNGFSGTYRDWSTRTQPRLGELADQYGMVMVMPDGRDSWYWDSPVNPKLQMESFIIKELVPHIDSHYPTRAEAAQRAITGLSMGGHGALWLAVNHPDVFGSAGSMSGGVDIRPFSGKWNTSKLLGQPYGKNPALWDSHTVATLIPKMKDAGLNIIFDCGKDDFFAAVNEQLHRDLLAANIPHDYTSRPGNHSHAYWANSVLHHLLFFNQAFNK